MTKILRGVVLGGLFLTPLIPFVVFSNLFFPFIAGKGFAFRIIIEIAFSAWIVLTLTDISYRPKRSWLFYAFAIFIGVVTLADIFGVNFYKSFWSNLERMDGLVTFLHLFAYFLMLGTTIVTEKMWNRFFNFTLIANTAMCLFSALPQIFGNAAIHQSTDRVDATFGNPIYFAVYLLINIFIALFLLLRSKNVYVKWLYVLSIALQFFLMYRTQTRGAMLGLILGLVVSMLAITIFEKERKNIRKISALVLVLIVLVIGVFLAARNTQFVKDSPTLQRFASLSLSENFLKSQGRYYIWPMGIAGFKENPILGWGQENFVYVFNKNYDPKMWTQEQWFDRTHNVVIDWLVSAGLLGLLSYLSIFVAILYYIWRGKGAPFSVADKSILTGLLVAYFFQNLFVFDNLTSYLLFVMIGAYVYSVRTSPLALPVAPRLVLSSGIAPKVVGSLVIIALVYVLYAGNIKQIQATMALYDAVAPETDGNFDYAKDLGSFKKTISYNTFVTEEAREHFVLLANKLNRPETPESVRVAVFQESANEMKKQVDETKRPNARNTLFLGSLLNSYGLFDQALFYLNQTHNLTPRKQSVYFEIVHTFATRGQFDEALGFAKEAFDLDPSYPDARMLYFSVAVKANKQDLAKELISDLDPKIYFFDDRIVSTYADVKQYDAVISILKKRVELNPTSSEHLLSLSAGYLLSGNRPMAIDVIRRFIALDPAGNKERGVYYISEIQAGRNP